MVAIETEESVHTFSISKTISIAAPIEIAFQAVLEEIGPGSVLPDGKPFPMKIEPWPGGRWFRDLGNNTGHLWGHVQVIKPPPHATPLLEITGPLFMSFAAINHLQYRLTEHGAGTRLNLIHRALGDIPADYREGMVEGWGEVLDNVRKAAEKR